VRGVAATLYRSGTINVFIAHVRPRPLDGAATIVLLPLHSDTVTDGDDRRTSTLMCVTDWCGEIGAARTAFHNGARYIRRIFTTGQPIDSHG